MLFEQFLFTQPRGSVTITRAFATTLYTGTSLARTITTGVNLSGATDGVLLQGGLVWVKDRSVTSGHRLYDTLRGATFALESSTTAAPLTLATSLTAFGSSGFNVGAASTVNLNTDNFVAWTFRRAKKYFDVVTYTGDGTSNRPIAHALDGTVGMVVTKITSTTGAWNVYHSSATGDLVLNTTAAQAASQAIITATSTTTFTVTGAANTNSATYVAYLFAHDTDWDGVVQCGTYTGNGSASGPTVTLGWEPQFVLVKSASVTGNWQMFDTTRGIVTGAAADAIVLSNTTGAETSSDRLSTLSTGFQITSTNSDVNTNAATYLYMAIREP